MNDPLKKFQITEKEKNVLNEKIKNGDYLMHSITYGNGLTETIVSKKGIDMMLKNAKK